MAASVSSGHVAPESSDVKMKPRWNKWLQNCLVGERPAVPAEGVCDVATEEIYVGGVINIVY